MCIHSPEKIGKKVEMKILKCLFQILLGIIAIPIGYLLISLILSSIPVNTDSENPDDEYTIFLSTNGVHLDIILPLELMDAALLEDLNKTATDRYLAVGWGEENFYLNTPQWSDLSLETAFKAAFMDNTSLLHITRYTSTNSHWIKVKLSKTELYRLNRYILDTFQLDSDGNKSLLLDTGYTPQDDFYKARGSYSFHHTCNSWVNAGFRESGLKAALWTPFDFGLMGKYE